MTRPPFALAAFALLVLPQSIWCQPVSQKAILAEEILAAREGPGRALDPGFRARALKGLLQLPIEDLQSSIASRSLIPLSLGDTTSDLVYRTLPQPCRIIDTRLTGGILSSSRSFRVAGTGSFADQGGDAAGCGIPLGGATAAMINFVAVSPEGAGNLRGSAWPNPVPTVGSIINYQALSPALNVANGVVFPICDAATSSCGTGFDITVQPNGANVHLVADVLGYFTRYPPPPGGSQQDLIYTTLQQPCRIIDTRVSGGFLSSGVSRDFKVAGTIGFEAQGGTAAGCGVPAGSTVAMINFVAVNAQGAGNLKGVAYPNAIPATGNVINYQALSPALNIANGVLFPICDPSGSTCNSDITLQPNGAGVDVVADVLGYFSSIPAPALAPAPGASPASQSNLTYTRFQQPCRIIDTRLSGGLLAPGTPRSFKVAGTTGFDTQGGTAGGCGVPAGATVAMINFVAVSAQGNGNLKGAAFPNAIPPTGSVINYQAVSPALNIANGLLFPICDPAVATCSSDITLQANASAVHVVADVMGYAKRSLPVADLDQDGDGWTPAQGDCCDVPGFGCAVPALVNPGAFEVPGNGIDDNCNGQVDEVATMCDNGLASNSTDPFSYAQAIDLCQTTTETPPIANRVWGVINAQLLLADGTGTPAAPSRSIRPNFGTGNFPRFGSSFVLLSTGNAASSSQVNPPFAAFQPGQNMGTTSGFPADWYAANGNTVPNSPGCPAPNGTSAQDPVMLKVRIRVPTNARSFSVSTKFFSSEFPEYVCSPFNDFFVVLLDSAYNGVPANPSDKNIAKYTTPTNSVYPVGVNLAFGNTGLFVDCVNGNTGCAGGTPGNISTCTGTSGLMSTGFDTADPGICDATSKLGGATAWLTVKGNVVPGETIELRFAIWDTSDHSYDSLVLLDNFQWSTQTTTPGAFIGN